MFISIEQIKAARALLDWTQADLAEKSGINVDQVRNFESGRSRSLSVLESIFTTFTKNDISFVEQGVIKRKSEIRILRGQSGFWDFYDDVYETVRVAGGDIFAHNVDEASFLKWLGPKKEEHRARMSILNNFAQKVIIREEDNNLAVDYGSIEYRTIPAKDFSSVPFYIYGDKLALITFKNDDVAVFIIAEPDITQAFKKLFLSIWDKATLVSL